MTYKRMILIRARSRGHGVSTDYARFALKGNNHKYCYFECSRIARGRPVYDNGMKESSQNSGVFEVWKLEFEAHVGMPDGVRQVYVLADSIQDDARACVRVKLFVDLDATSLRINDK